VKILAFKAPQLEGELFAADERLRTVLLYAAAFVVYEGFADGLTVTCGRAECSLTHRLSG
jgi:hypothetical protein